METTGRREVWRGQSLTNLFAVPVNKGRVPVVQKLVIDVEERYFPFQSSESKREFIGRRGRAAFPIPVMRDVRARI